jgi:hypothetical protein
MEATRLAPAGRACSKFVWQCRLLKNWAVRMLRYLGRPVFRQIAHRRRVRITNRRGVGLSLRLWRFDTQLSISALLKRGRISSSDLIRPPKGDRFCPVLCGTLAGFLGRWLATLLPRLGVTPRGRNAADGGRLTANHGSAPRGRIVGRRLLRLGPGRNSLANSKRSRINSAQRA